MKQVYLDEATHQELKARAALAGVKMGILIRQLLGESDAGVNSSAPQTPEIVPASPPKPTEPEAQP